MSGTAWQSRILWLRALAAFSVAAGLAFTGAGGCSQDSRPSPKSVVRGLFGAIAESDTAFIILHVDLSTAAQSVREELIDLSTDTSEAEPQWDQRLIEALTGDGELRERWMANQIVLGEQFIHGDTAWVEVSFLDRVTRVQYYNRMRLLRRDDRWMIVSFRAL
jgi:hypothetical protein